MYCQFAPPYGVGDALYGAITRLTRSSEPWSNSWLPTAETSRPASLSASIVGLSFCDERLEHRRADQVTSGSEHRVRVVAPQLLDRARQHRGTRRRPRSVVLEPTVEVVRRQDLDVLWSSAVSGVDATISGLWSDERNGPELYRFVAL